MERGVKLKNMTTKPDSGISISNYLPPQPVKPNKMSKFQIEKVDHAGIYNYHTCCSIDYFPKSDKLLQVNYVSENNARLYACERTVGIWKLKSLKNKTN